MNKALFLDRDGVVNTEYNYVCKITDFEFTNGIFELCKKFQDRNYLIFIITNQSGIARGLYNTKDFELLTNWMLKQFEKNGISIQKVYFCPHHPDYTGDCSCRKPKPGMIIQAKNEYNLDLADSFLIGDKIRDIESGKNAGISNNILIKSGNLPNLKSIII